MNEIREHEQALRIELSDIRLLGLLPKDVRILSTLPPPETLPYCEAWCPGHGSSPIYLHIRHGYCFLRTHTMAPLIIETLPEFLRRYKQLNGEELVK